MVRPKEQFGANLVNGSFWAWVGWLLSHAAGPHAQQWPLYLVAGIFLIGFGIMYYDRAARSIRTLLHRPEVQRRGRIAQTEGRTLIKWRGGEWNTLSQLPPASLMFSGALSGLLQRKGSPDETSSDT